MNDKDDLLKRAEELKKRAQRIHKTGQKKSRSVISETQEQITEIHTTFSQIKATITWLYRTFIYPVITHPWLGKPFVAYRNLWNRVVYIEKDENPKFFSRKRAGLMVVATIIFLKLLPLILSTAYEFVYDSSRMLTSYKSKEIWYLGKSQEIDPEGNVFSAQGCATIECSDQTSIYFRIKPSLAHHLWSLFHNQNLFFPDFVAAGIQNDINKCTVTGYGSRSKFIVRNWDVYPQILSVNCIPLTEENIRQGTSQ